MAVELAGAEISGSILSGVLTLGMLPGCKMWHNPVAGGVVLVPATSDGIKTGPDQTAWNNFISSTQNTAAAPVTATDSLGRAVWRYSTFGKRVVQPNYGLNFLHTGSSRLMMVVNITAYPSTATTLFRSAISAGPGIGIQMNTNGSISYYVTNTTAGLSTTATTAAAIYPLGVPFLLEIEFISAPTTGFLRVYINGVQRISQARSAAVVSPLGSVLPQQFTGLTFTPTTGNYVDYYLSLAFDFAPFTLTDAADTVIAAKALIKSDFAAYAFAALL